MFGHKCSKCGAPCEWRLHGFLEGWWCRRCHERKEQKNRIDELEKRLSRLEKLNSVGVRAEAARLQSGERGEGKK